MVAIVHTHTHRHRHTQQPPTLGLVLAGPKQSHGKERQAATHTHIAEFDLGLSSWPAAFSLTEMAALWAELCSTHVRCPATPHIFLPPTHMHTTRFSATRKHERTHTHEHSTATGTRMHTHHTLSNYDAGLLRVMTRERQALIGSSTIS